MKKKMSQLFNEIFLRLENCNKELTKLMGKNSAYGHIDISHDLLNHQWVDIDYSQELTKEQKRALLKVIEKHLGKISHYEFNKRFKTERRGDGSLRYNTYYFLCYLKGYKDLK